VERSRVEAWEKKREQHRGDSAKAATPAPMRSHGGRTEGRSGRTRSSGGTVGPLRSSQSLVPSGVAWGGDGSPDEKKADSTEKSSAASGTPPSSASESARRSALESASCRGAFSPDAPAPKIVNREAVLCV